jgi:hypothetical protein
MFLFSPEEKTLAARRKSLYEPRVVLNIILAALAFLSLGIILWQFVVALRFPLHRRVADPGYTPPVIVFKPLKGVDAETWHCLESWCTKTTPGRCKSSSASRWRTTRPAKWPGN